MRLKSLWAVMLLPLVLLIVACSVPTRAMDGNPYQTTCYNDYAALPNGGMTAAQYHAAPPTQQQAADASVLATLQTQGATLSQAQDAESLFHLASTEYVLLTIKHIQSNYDYLQCSPDTTV